MYDWREFNSYFVPFSPFGNPTVNRLAPAGGRGVPLRPLPGRTAPTGRGGGTAARNGEPFGEIGLVTQRRRLGRPERRPRRPAAGNRPGQRDTGSTAEYGIWTDADNGSAMLLSVGDATVTEADAGTTVVSVLVIRSGPATDRDGHGLDRAGHRARRQRLPDQRRRP